MSNYNHDVYEALLRENLYYFVRKSFETLHPGQEFIPAWHVEAICRQLEKIANGETRRLLTTVPPRHLKSICTAVAFIVRKSRACLPARSWP